MCDLAPASLLASHAVGHVKLAGDACIDESGPNWGTTTHLLLGVMSMSLSHSAVSSSSPKSVAMG